MKLIKKVGFWICLAASVLIIGTTALGWEINAEKDTSTGTTVEDTVE